jgi:hypothetical protein
MIIFNCYLNKFVFVQNECIEIEKIVVYLIQTCKVQGGLKVTLPKKN